MKKYPSMKSIKQNVLICKKCNLCNDRKNAVPGKGNQNADIVFNLIGILYETKKNTFSDVHINIPKKIAGAAKRNGVTNIVKCRPPKNRAPNDTERMMCSDYLENELTIIKPKIICLMGNTAYHSILDGKEISKNHGRLIHKNNRVYFVTFHPAAIIYNQKLGKIFSADIKKMVSILQKLNKKHRD